MFVKGPPGCNPLRREDRMPIVRTISGDTCRIDARLTAIEGGPASSKNSHVEFVLSENQFSPPLWTGKWNAGIKEDENRPGLVHIEIPLSISKALRRGSYSFSVRVSDLLDSTYKTQLEGKLLVEYAPTSDQRSIPYRDGTSDIFSGGGEDAGGDSAVPSDELETVKKMAQDAQRTAEAAGSKADEAKQEADRAAGVASTAIQGVKVNGSGLTPGEDRVVDVSVPVQSVNNKTGAVVLTASDVGAATLASPKFTGTPTAPDIELNAPDGQIANKKYVDEQLDTESPLVARSFTTTGPKTDNYNNTVLYFRPRFFGMNNGDRFKGLTVCTRDNGTAIPALYARLRRFSDNVVLAISNAQPWPSMSRTNVHFSFPVSVVLPDKDNYYYIDFVTENSTTATSVQIGLRVYNYTPATNPDCYFGGNTAVPILTAQFYSFASDLQTTGNLVTSLSAQSTDTQYPSAKCVYDAIDLISVTPLSGQTFDFTTMQGIFAGVKACIEALGGSVTNFPTIPVNQ